MTWDIFLGIVALVGFIIAIGKLVSSNTKALTELTCAVNMLKEELNTNKADTKENEHKIDNLEDKYQNHEGRIVKLESK